MPRFVPHERLVAVSISAHWVHFLHIRGTSGAVEHHAWLLFYKHATPLGAKTHHHVLNILFKDDITIPVRDGARYLLSPPIEGKGNLKIP